LLAQSAKDWTKADTKFETRCKITKLLRVKVVLSKVDGVRYAEVKCVLGKEKFVTDDLSGNCKYNRDIAKSKWKHTLYLPFLKAFTILRKAVIIKAVIWHINTLFFVIALRVVKTGRFIR